MTDGTDDGLVPADRAPLITPEDVPPSSTTPTSPPPTTAGDRSPDDASRDAGDVPAKGEPTPQQGKPARSRTGAVWVGIFVGALLMIALIIFLLQNTDEVEVHFLGWTGTAPLAVALLIAGVGVALIAVVVGTLRIAQLRRRLGAARKAAGTPK